MNVAKARKVWENTPLCTWHYQDQIFDEETQSFIDTCCPVMALIKSIDPDADALHETVDSLWAKYGERLYAEFYMTITDCRHIINHVDNAAVFWAEKHENKPDQWRLPKEHIIGAAEAAIS